MTTKKMMEDDNDIMEEEEKWQKANVKKLKKTMESQIYKIIVKDDEGKEVV